MGYESLSTVIVLVIALIGLAFWLPARTRKGMRWVQEHREDKYSTSLHLVDGRSGTRFSDGHARTEGIVMQSNMGHLSSQHVAEVRRLRRESIRRRRLVVLALAAITALVAVCAFALHFSPWFALIPAALLGAVLALGARAAKQARQWERKVARAAQRTASPAAPVVYRAQQPAGDKSIAAHDVQQAATQVMEQCEIRSVLRKAQIEGRQALERHAAAEPARPSASSNQAKSSQSGLSVSAHESEAVRPASSSQDLISFSLGRHDGESSAPESLEIKSTRQVAKAEPVRTGESADTPQPAHTGKPAVPLGSTTSPAEADAQTNAAAIDDLETFHLSERQAEVAVPAGSSDSLSVGLEAILTRRKA